MDGDDGQVGGPRGLAGWTGAGVQVCSPDTESPLAAAGYQYVSASRPAPVELRAPPKSPRALPATTHRRFSASLAPLPSPRIGFRGVLVAQHKCGRPLDGDIAMGRPCIILEDFLYLPDSASARPPPLPLSALLGGRASGYRPAARVLVALTRPRPSASAGSCVVKDVRECRFPSQVSCDCRTCGGVLEGGGRKKE